MTPIDAHLFDPSAPFLPGPGYWRELRRPWKLFSLGVGMGWLLYGALFYEIGDWDRLANYPLGAESMTACYLDAVLWAEEMTEYTSPVAA